MNISNSRSTNPEYKNTTCNLTENPWCGEFGAQQYFEVFYLSLLVVLGVFGNLLVIFSILIQGKAFKHGNVFIINLAIADFLVTGIYTPTVIVNVLAQGLGLPEDVCKAFGYIIIASCSASMWNLGFIALNRYWAVVHRPSYRVAFSKRNIYLMALFVWVWPNFLIIPTLTGWSSLQYDAKAMVCSYDEVVSLGYNLLLMLGAILIPLISTIFCYLRLFRFVQVRRQKVDRNRRLRQASTNNEIEAGRRRIQREISLVKTLATAVVVFVLCWAPYTSIVLFAPASVDPLTKKISNWLGLCNSAINFILYGVLNQGYRDGYKKLISVIFCCKSCVDEERISTANASSNA